MIICNVPIEVCGLGDLLQEAVHDLHHVPLLLVHRVLGPPFCRVVLPFVLLIQADRLNVLHLLNLLLGEGVGLLPQPVLDVLQLLDGEELVHHPVVVLQQRVLLQELAAPQ